VRLLGFNGGRISAVEYAVAAAFGARVGIVEGSGRAAAEFLADPLWTEPVQEEDRVRGSGTAADESHAGQLRQAGGSRRLPNIEALPATVDAIRAFLGGEAGA